MPITVPDNIVRVTWNFGLHQGSTRTEVAEMTLNGRLLDAFGNEPASFPTEPHWVPILEAIATAARVGWADNMAASHFPGSLTLDSVRCALNNTAGHTKAEAYSTSAPDAPWGGRGASSLPWQLAFCISNYATVPGLFAVNGKSRRGRVYLPPFDTSMLGVNDDGQVSTANVASILHDWDQTVLATTDALIGSDAPGLKWQSGVLSAHLSQWHQTQYWRADQIIDTQRRRRNRETSGYTNLAYLSS